MRQGKRYIILAWVCVAALTMVAQKQMTVKEWQLRSSTEVDADDARVSENGFDTRGWYDVMVPTTVLNAFVNNGIYPDPRRGMDNFVIPDVSDEFNARHGLNKYNYLDNGKNPWQDPYWYRTMIVIPKEYRGKRIWLKLDGINYRADVWVNGKLVADSSKVVGMFRRFKFDITDKLNKSGDNTIAIKVYQVDHPGTPNPGTQFVLFGSNRGSISELFRDETLKFSGGWDCAPVIRDRNMGIYQEVKIEATGDVTIEDPWVETILPEGNIHRAELTVRVPLMNHSDREITGTLIAGITTMQEVNFNTYTKKIDKAIAPIEIKKRLITLAPGEEREIELNVDEFPQLSVKEPLLWYPNGYGEQYLHNLELKFTPNGGNPTSWDSHFGMREVKSTLMSKQIPNSNEKDYGRVFYINGVKIFCRGGWLQPDALLADTKKGIYDQARLLANANVTLIGSEDMPSPSEDWLDSWDKYGLMNWHVFHQCYRMFPGRDTQNNPDNHELATECVRDMVKRYRNHPCIIAWFGVNEVCVAEDLYISTKKAVEELDRTRPYIPTTSISWDVDKLTPYLRADMPTGTTDDGAPDYNWAPSEYYFDKVEEVYTQMFKNELGMPAVPVYESLCKFIPTINKPYDERDRLFPLDSIWAEHGAWDANNFCFRGYDNAIRTFYSDPTSARDYARKAQMLSAEGYRAMIEAANHRMWDITTGVMLWKLNSCWPDVCWQIYDWYLTPNAAYYFAKKAMEPVHVQLNANTNQISVINATPKPIDSIVVKGKIVDFFQKEVWNYSDTVAVAPDSYIELATVPSGGKLAAVYLVKLTLEDMAGNQISENVYWRYSQHQNFYWLVNMPKGELTKEVDVHRDGDEYAVTVELSNNSENTSFFNYLTLGETPDGASVNPVFWSDNFVTLFPGERKTVSARVAVEDMKGKQPVVRIEQK